MSSSYVRGLVNAWVAANKPGAISTVVDLSDSHTLADLPAASGTTPWIGVQFVQATEERVSIGPDSCWREEGIFYLHVVVPSGFTSATALGHCETLRTALRGQRLAADMYVRSVDPPSDTTTIALGLDGPWKGWTVVADYYRDLHA